MLPADFGYDWSGESFEEIRNAGQQGIAYGLALVFVFLLLAALYESWSLPFSVILGTPFAMLGALFGTWLLSLTNNVYTQIGIVLLIGLAAKNSILIVEFAKMKYDEGTLTPDEAAMEGRGCDLPDPHDVVRVHLRHAAAGVRERLGCELTHRAGHDGGVRHDDRDGAGDLPDPDALRAHRAFRRLARRGEHVVEAAVDAVCVARVLGPEVSRPELIATGGGELQRLMLELVTHDIGGMRCRRRSGRPGPFRRRLADEWR